MTLAEIHERTHLPIYRMRYVLDNDIVPNAERAGQGRGNARDFSAGDTILIALAAALFENGLNAAFINGFIARMIHDRSSIGAITLPPEDGDIQRLEIAEQVYGRLITNSRPTTEQLQWFDTRTKVYLNPAYLPVAYVSVDVAEMRRRLFSN